MLLSQIVLSWPWVEEMGLRWNEEEGGNYNLFFSLLTPEHWFVRELWETGDFLIGIVIYISFTLAWMLFSENVIETDWKTLPSALYFLQCQRLEIQYSRILKKKRMVGGKTKLFHDFTFHGPASSINYLKMNFNPSENCNFILTVCAPICTCISTCTWLGLLLGNTIASLQTRFYRFLSTMNFYHQL